MKQVAVIGGGMAGTAAAHWLTSRGYDVIILEQSDRLGGRIRSECIQGAVTEMGAGFMTKGYANLLTFLAESGLNQQLYRQRGSSGIIRAGRVAMPTFRTLAGNSPLSLGTKARAASLLLKTFAAWPWLDLHAFWKAAKYDDRAVSAMFPSSRAQELLEYVLQPILNGYFYWTPEHTSQAMMLLLCRTAFSHGTYKMQGGLQRIPEKAAEDSIILLEHIVQNVQRKNDKYAVVASHNNSIKILDVDGIVCATTASAVNKLFPGLTRQQRQFFEAVEYSSGALMSCTYEAAQTCDDTAIAFPRQEGIGLSSVTVSSEPSAGGVPLTTVKTYASGDIAAQLSKLSDDALVMKLTADMEPVRPTVLVGDPTPIATYVQRWPQALPFFDVGHFKRLANFEAGKVEDTEQSLVFAGDYIGGPFMEGAFTSGVRAAERLNARFQ